MAFAHRHKWAIPPTIVLATVGGVWWHHHHKGGDAVHTEDGVSVNSGSGLFRPLEENLVSPHDIPQEIERGHRARQASRKRQQAATDIQKIFRGRQVRQASRKRQQAATDIQKIFRGHRARKAFEEEQARHASKGHFPKLIRVEKYKRLGSAEMRGFIGSQWMEHLEGFQPSNSIFIRGGVKKPTFFWRKNDADACKTYIVPANDYEANDKDIKYVQKYVQSGEQSISIVLSSIKHAIEQEYNYDSTLLIPLQQLDKSHWVLLEVVLRQRGTTIDVITSTARCYDSKPWASVSNIIDNSTGKARVDYVKKVVGDTFGIDTEWIREGTQPPLNNYNCGRYTLIKMGALLQLTDAPKTIDDINKILSPDSVDETQTGAGKAAEDLSSTARDSVGSDDSSDWEPVS